MTSAKPRPAAQDQIHRLQTLLERAGGFKPPVPAAPLIPTGSPALDGLLPQGGYTRGSLIEWLSETAGSGAAALALTAAREAHAEGGAVVIVDRTGTFYPLAAAAWGLDLASTIIVHPSSDKDEQWALDQALRCEHAAAVLAWPKRLDGRTFRRLQLAAESSGALGLFIRPLAAQREPSWANIRLAVTPRPIPLPPSEPARPRARRTHAQPTIPTELSPRASPTAPNDLPAASTGWQLCVRLLRCRGRFGKKEGEVLVEIDERTGEIHAARPRNLASELAPPATTQHKA